MASRILFTGGRSPATLALLRLFGQAGYHCQVAESLQPNLAGASRYCRQNHRIAPPRQQTKGFINDLKALIEREKIELLIPTCEEVFYVSRYLRELESERCRVFTSSIDLLTNLHSKYQFNQLIRALKLPAPASERIASQSQLERLLPEWGPCVLKLEFSRFASHVLIQPRAEAIAEQVHPSEDAAWVLQEYLPGQQFCSYSVAIKGNLTAHSVYPTVYSMGAGATIRFEQVRIAEIEQMVAKIVQSLDYSGQISFDFIYSKGLYYPIECNPRTTTGSFLFAAQDHLPEAFFEDQAFKLRRPTAEPVALKLPMLVYALPKHLNNLGAFLKDLSQTADPLMRLDDFGPFNAQFGLMWQTWRQARKSGVGLMAASTHDIEWNGFWGS